MNDTIQSDWKQYKNNPHIEKNIKTLKFRCTRCNLDLGTNPGGASSHSQAAHKIKLDGSTLEKKIETVPVTEQKISENSQTKEPTPSKSSLSFYQIFRKYNPESENKPLLQEQQHDWKNAYDDFERKKFLYSSIKEAEKAGLPDKIIEPLYRELGIKPEDEQKLKEKKDQEKKQKKIEDLNRKFVMLFSLAGSDYEVRRRLGILYIIELNKI